MGRGCPLPGSLTCRLVLSAPAPMPPRELLLILQDRVLVTFPVALSCLCFLSPFLNARSFPHSFDTWKQVSGFPYSFTDVFLFFFFVGFCFTETINSISRKPRGESYLCHSSLEL